MKKVSGVYQIRNKINGKIYIGSSVNVQNRVSVHRVRLRKGSHGNPYLQNAWNKYGEENFEFELLEEVDVRENAVIREQWYLDNCNPDYNVVKRAEATNLGRKFPKSYGEKISKIKRELYKTRKNPFHGKTHDNETRKRMSEIAKRRRHSKETKSKISKAQIGEKSHYAKLTWDKVREIRRLYEEEGYSEAEIVRYSGMSQSAINKLLNYKTWRE